MEFGLNTKKNNSSLLLFCSLHLWLISVQINKRVDNPKQTVERRTRGGRGSSAGTESFEAFDPASFNRRVLLCANNAG